MTGPRREAATLLKGLTAPDLAAWSHLTEPAAPPREGGELRVTFLGVSTLLLEDGETAVLTDGFFSRPGPLRLLAGRVSPDRPRIREALRRAGIDRLDALFVAHSHYDHALDAATVAVATGARLIGSASTRNIARGEGFPDDRFVPAVTGTPMRFGRFRLTALPARHSPGDVAPGRIAAPLPSPARARAYRTGECYSLHVGHGDRTLLIHASAHYLTGALAEHPAETVYLGVGALGKQPPEFRGRYWHETVTVTGARRVVPIHWDDFTRPLTRPLRPLPAAFDDFTTTMSDLRERADRAGVALALPALWQRTDPLP